MADSSAPGLGPYPLPPGALEAQEQITPELLRHVTTELSSDRFEGRGPGSPGDARARAWLAEQLQGLGFRPGAEGGWEQPFPIVGVDATVPERWSFHGQARPGSAVTLRFWDEFIASSGVQQETAEVSDAEVVFVGYGIDAPEQGWNDFGETDLRGKVLLILNDDPDWDPALFAGPRRLYYGRWTYKYEEAARRGAAGAIIIHTPASAGYPWSVVQTSWDGPQFGLPAAGEPTTAIHAWVTQDAAAQLVQLGGHRLQDLVKRARSPEFEPVPLGVRTSLSLENRIERAQTANVLGLLPGSERPDEVVILTAHHDHLGRGEGEAGQDVIYNGARDNATGVAQALAVARALCSLPRAPARSTLILLVGGEEQGLLGSKYYARHPTFEPRKIAANINFELGNIWGPTHDVVIHGLGKNDLDARVEAAADTQQRRVRDEADPGSGWYYRSDQLSFARIGVPSIWFESGRDFVGRPRGWGDEVVPAWIEQHYHQPSDEVTPQWNFEGMALDARLGFLVAAAVAEGAAMPRWREGDEFANRR